MTERIDITDVDENAGAATADVTNAETEAVRAAETPTGIAPSVKLAGDLLYGMLDPLA